MNDIQALILATGGWNKNESWQRIYHNACV